MNLSLTRRFPIPAVDWEASCTYRPYMATALTMLFIIIGLLLIGQHFFWGLVLIGLGGWFSTMRTARDEERLIAVLALLAFLGVTITIIHIIYQRLS